MCGDICLVPLCDFIHSTGTTLTTWNVTCTVYVVSFATRRILHVCAQVAALCSNVRRRRMKIKLNSLYWRTNGFEYWYSFPPKTKKRKFGWKGQLTNRVVRNKVRLHRGCNICHGLVVGMWSLLPSAVFLWNLVWMTEKYGADWASVFDLFVNWSWCFNVT